MIKATLSEQLKELRRQIYEQPLPADEFARQVALTLGDEEDMQAAREFCRWFKRRYPTAKARLDYANQRYREWMRMSPI